MNITDAGIDTLMLPGMEEENQLVVPPNKH